MVDSARISALFNERGGGMAIEDIKFYSSDGKEIKPTVANGEHGILYFPEPVAMVDLPFAVQWKQEEAA
jgi:hypothetical protein